MERMTTDEAVANLEQILEEIRSIRIPCKEQEIAVTMSFGVAEYNRKTDVDSLLKQADDLLYLAKEKGRNQIQRG